jgi:hypothetical protein
MKNFCGNRFKTYSKHLVVYAACITSVFGFNMCAQAQWTEVGSINANSYIHSLCVTKNGTVLAGGGFQNDSNYNYVAAWNGSSWKELGGNNALGVDATIRSIVSNDDGDIFIGGDLIEGSDYVVARWDGSAYSITGNKGFTGNIAAMTTDSKGNLYVGGSIHATGTPAKLVVAAHGVNLIASIRVFRVLYAA